MSTIYVRGAAWEPHNFTFHEYGIGCQHIQPFFIVQEAPGKVLLERLRPYALAPAVSCLAWVTGCSIPPCREMCRDFYYWSLLKSWQLYLITCVVLILCMYRGAGMANWWTNKFVSAREDKQAISMLNIHLYRNRLVAELFTQWMGRVHVEDHALEYR